MSQQGTGSEKRCRVQWGAKAGKVKEGEASQPRDMDVRDEVRWTAKVANTAALGLRCDERKSDW